MKIFIIGGNGKVGKKVTEYFKANNEVIVGARNNGDISIDISKSQSIKTAFEKIGSLDAIICIAGEAKWDFFDNLSEEDFHIGLNSKLMGQVNLVRIGKEYLNEKGSITLSTGILADDPVEKTTSAAMVNGAIHSFVKAVDLELEKGIRINAVSLGVVQDAYEKYKDYFPGHNPIPMQKVINAYAKSVLGKGRGQVFKYYDN